VGAFGVTGRRPAPLKRGPMGGQKVGGVRHPSPFGYFAGVLPPSLCSGGASRREDARRARNSLYKREWRK
jgi:hypothetical protein